MTARHLLIPLLVTMLLAVLTQQSAAEPRRDHHERPRLVLGIMVDQMRYDYFYRFWEQYGDGGFRRLLNEGFSFANANLDYFPPYTGPGHASVYTGTVPASHGIIGNQWYLRDEDRMTYVVSDPEVEPIGTESDAGRMSPRWLLASTLADELILHSNQRSQAIAFSLKDRGSILPAGRLGQAFWLEPASGRVISSSHYMDALPDWVDAFNEQDLVADLLAEPWKTLLPLDEGYEASIADRNPYEFRFSRTFPHNVPAMKDQQGRQVLQYLPAGDVFTAAFARAAIEGAGLGQDEHTDLLAISFSSPDYIGHAYAPASVEVKDAYLRLDRELESLLDYLDERIGLDQVLVFLTADHGVAHNPRYVRDLGFPAEYYHGSRISEQLETWMEDRYGANLLASFSNNQVFLDRDAIDNQGLERALVETEVARFMLQEVDGVVGALTATTLENSEFTQGLRRRVQHGYHQQRSGDVTVWFRPQWLPDFLDGTGSTHASIYSYDNRVPMVFFGWDIPAGESAAAVGVADIAPTVAMIMNTPFPTNVSGRPLLDLIHGR